jgi:Zn-dependent membrane protease YugP
MLYGFDPLWLLFMIPGLLLGIWAQVRLMHVFGKYSQVAVDSGMTGAEAARRILDQAGLQNVPVEAVPGRLSDHYDPSKHALFLSADNYYGRSVAAVGVAAHESGHALQHQAAYGLLAVRTAIVPAVQFANYAWMGILLIGWIFAAQHYALIIDAAVVIFSIMTLFQLVTLPVEYDASRRAKEQLFRLGLVHEHERAGAAKVLDAAALTYVAALVSTILQLLFFIIRMQGSRR